MDIEAIARLEYCDGESLGVWEGLSIVVKFKEKGKIFKTKLTKRIVSVIDIDGYSLKGSKMFRDYDEYFYFVIGTIEDEFYLKSVARELIKDYFQDEKKNLNEAEQRKLISKKVGNLAEFKVNVTIK